jgi:hypothetical protein
VRRGMVGRMEEDLAKPHRLHPEVVLLAWWTGSKSVKVNWLWPMGGCSVLEDKGTG